MIQLKIFVLIVGGGATCRNVIDESGRRVEGTKNHRKPVAKFSAPLQFPEVIDGRLLGLKSSRSSRYLKLPSCLEILLVAHDTQIFQLRRGYLYCKGYDQHRRGLQTVVAVSGVPILPLHIPLAGNSGPRFMYLLCLSATVLFPVSERMSHLIK